MLSEFLKIIDAGGAVALAIVIWYELRLFRVSMTKALGDLALDQARISERTRVIEDRVVGFTRTLTAERK